MSDAGEGFGAWLRACRRRGGLSQEELAERSGLSVRAIRNLERGSVRWPYRETLRRLADALELGDAVRAEFIGAAGRRLACDGGAGAAQPGDESGQPDSGRQSGGHYLAGSLPAPANGRLDQAGGGLIVVPRQLPAAVAQFAGRAAELAMLDRWLERVPPGGAGGAVVICAIGGMAGVGKTALALRWAHRVAGRFPDGQLYVNLRGYDPSGQPADAGEVVRGFLGALGVAPGRIPAGLDGQAGLYRSLLSGRRMLIVADNARDAAQVRPLLPGAPGSLVLVTSRSQLGALAAADGACVLSLEVPAAAEAAELLAARVGAGRVAAEPEAAAELVRLCGRLPLALVIAAARAATSGWPLAALAAQLAVAGGRLSALGLGDAGSDVQAVFSWSRRQLSPLGARMFRLLGIHPGPDISDLAAASLAGLSPPQARGALRELAGVSLIAEPVPGRYVLHDLLRAYAAQQARAGETAGGRRAAAHRMLDHYLHTAQGAARALDPAEDILAPGPPQPGVTPEVITGCDQALAWFGAEHQVLLAVTGQIAETGFDDHARQLPWTLMTFLDRAGHWHDLVATQHAALACAERLDDLAGQARTHRDLGRARIRLGQAGLARAHLAQAVELSRRLGDRAAEARAHLALSVVFEHEGQIPESLSSSMRALNLAEAAEDPILQASACNNIGYDHARLGDTGQGLAYCQRALDLYRQHSKPSLEASTWDSLGYIYRHLGDYQHAAASYQRAIGLFGQAGARYLSAQSLTQLGDTHHTAGHTRAARHTWQQALAILDHLAPSQASQIRTKLQDPR